MNAEPYKLWVGSKEDNPSRDWTQEHFNQVLAKGGLNSHSPDRDLMVAALTAFCYQLSQIAAGNCWWRGQLDILRRDGDIISGRTSGTSVWLKVPITEGPW